MQAQLRRYRIRAGQVDRFAAEWRAGVAPLRRQHGFRVHGWVVDGSDEFVWVLEHEDRASFEAADAAYYESEARRALRPDPARLIAEATQEWMTTTA